jgi:hypothetical protein
MATASILPNTSSSDDPVNTQPDADTGGSSFLDSLETLTLGVVSAAAGAANQAIEQGRMPYDPNDPGFGAIRPAQTSARSNPLGLLILIFILWKVFK